MATGDGSYITVEDVRVNAGYFETTTMTDSRLGTNIIARVEAETEKYLNTKLSPTTTIEIIDGNGLDRIFLRHLPVLRIDSATSDDDSITPAYLHFYSKSGMVVLDGDAEVGEFVADQRSVKIKYLHGYMNETSTQTATTAAATSGTSVALTVSSESSFAANDWVLVYGTDGKWEAAQVSSTATNTITVDSLSQDHASGSIVAKLETHPVVKEFMIVEAAIRLIGAVIGLTSTDMTSYGLGDLQVTKGEPYAQWRATLQSLYTRRNELRSRLRPMPMAIG